MRAILGCLVLVTCLPLTGAGQDLSTPEKTITTFVTSLAHCDAQQAVSCIDGAKYYPEYGRLFGAAKQVTPDDIEITVRKITKSGDDNLVTLSGRFNVFSRSLLNQGKLVFPSGLILGTDSFNVQMKRTDTGWRILPEHKSVVVVDNQPIVRSSKVDSSINAITTLLSDKATFDTASVPWETSLCLYNMRQLGLKMQMFEADHNSKITLSDATLVEQLKPYCKDAPFNLFSCPFDKPGARSYSFNNHLSNLTSTQISQPKRVILLYEGKDGHVEYRHHGYATIVSVDGHAVAVTPQTIQKYRWTP